MFEEVKKRCFRWLRLHAKQTSIDEVPGDGAGTVDTAPGNMIGRQVLA